MMQMKMSRFESTFIDSAADHTGQPTLAGSPVKNWMNCKLQTLKMFGHSIKPLKRIFD